MTSLYKFSLAGVNCIFLATISFIILVGIPIYSEASGEKVDSLRQVIFKHQSEKKDAEAMIALAKEFVKANMNDSARYYAEKALEIAATSGNIEIMAAGYIIICRDQWMRGQLPEARITSRKMIFFNQKLNDPDKLAKAYYHQGVVFGMSGESDSAIMCFRLSLQLVKSDSTTLVASYLGLGNNFGQLGEYDSSIYYKLKAARIAELEGNFNHLSTIYGGIGIAMDKIGNSEESERYFRLALESAQKINFTGGIADALLKLAGVYFKKNEFDSSLIYLNKSKKLFKAIGDASRWSELYDYYGLIYNKQHSYSKALEMYDSALLLFKTSNAIPELMNTFRNKASVYDELKNSDKTWLYLDSAYKIAVEYGFRDDQMQLLKLMGQISYLSGNYKRAAEERDLAYVLKDSLFNEEKMKANLELIQKYEKEKDQAQILALEKESLKRKLQRNLLLFNSSALIAAALFFLMLLRHKLIKTRLISQQKIQKLEEEKKIMMARNLVEGQEEERKRIAMELHDGLGVILSATKMQFTSIKDDIPKGHPVIKKAIQMLEQATGEVRRISHNMMPGLLTKLGLYEAVEDLFENINEMDDIEADVEIEGERVRLPENIEIMIYRIIQEMVNNTLKYAKAGRIDLALKISDAFMIIHYKDDGIGFDVEEKLRSATSSLGLKSIESRVAFLNGEMKLESAPGKGVGYTIRVPV